MNIMNIMILNQIVSLQAVKINSVAEVLFWPVTSPVSLAYPPPPYLRAKYNSRY